MLDKKQFIAGVVDRYPEEELLDRRINIEANVIGCIYKCPDIISETKFTNENFKTKDARFLFSIAKKLSDKGINVFDEVSIVSNFDEDIISAFHEIGGYTSVSHLASIVNEDNYESYADDLSKSELILKLYDIGFNLFDPVQIGNSKKKERPIDTFKKLNAQEILDYWEMQLSNIDISIKSNDILDECELDIDDDSVNKIQDGTANGIPFNTFGKDENGNEITVYPVLSSFVNGILPKTTFAVCGFSSTGKSCLWTSIILGLLYQGKSALIISNEMEKTPYIMNILTWIAYKKYHCYTLTKDKLRSGNLDDKEKEVLDKTKKFWKENYKGKLHFIHIPDMNMNLVKRKVRQYAIRKGIDFFLIDTLKAQVNDMNGNDTVWIDLLRSARIADELAKRYNLACGLSIQLNSANKGKLFLDESCISNCKQILETCETMLAIRNTYDIKELLPGNKEYLRPFWIEKNPSTGKYEKIEKQIPTDQLDYNYKVIFCIKNRNGINTESSGQAFLYSFIGQQAVFKESYRCHPVHGYIQ